MSNDNEISTNKDIVRKVAEATGATEKQVEYILKFITKYIHSLMKNPKVLSIKLPYIGYMYLKRGFLDFFRYREVFYKQNSPQFRKAQLFSIKRRNYLTKLMVTKCERRHAKRSIITDKRYIGIRSHEDIENYQNTKWK